MDRPDALPEVPAASSFLGLIAILSLCHYSLFTDFSQILTRARVGHALVTDPVRENVH